MSNQGIFEIVQGVRAGELHNDSRSVSGFQVRQAAAFCWQRFSTAMFWPGASQVWMMAGFIKEHAAPAKEVRVPEGDVVLEAIFKNYGDLPGVIPGSDTRREHTEKYYRIRSGRTDSDFPGVFRIRPKSRMGISH